MKVVDFLKERKEFLAQNPFELKDWLSPSIRDYWIEFLNKANHSQLGTWVRDQKVAGASVAEEEVDKPIELSPKAEAVFEQLQSQMGQEVHIGHWLCVDQARINAFAEVTHDHQWLHTDPQRAKEESPFKTTIAHGFLTLSLLPYLTQSVSDEEQAYPDAKMVVNYGLDKVRFPYPVKVDNNIRARTTLVKVTPIRRGLELVKEIKVEIEGCRRPGCVTESITRLYF